MKKKNTTIDDLARMIQGEFVAVQQKLDRMGKNMSNLLVVNGKKG